MSSTKISTGVVVVAAVFSRLRFGRVEVLVFQRSGSRAAGISAGSSGCGKWEFPGGKVEVGETLPLALQREIMEELAIEVRVQEKLSETLYRYPHRLVHLLAYFCQPVCADYEMKMVLSDHQAFRWVDQDQIREVDLAAADIPLVEEIFKKLEAKKAELSVYGNK